MRYRPRLRRGLTLLEVIVSTAIFLIALVALVQLVTLGHEHARNAREQTDALQKAQAKLALVIAGDPDYPISTGGNGGYDTDEDPQGAWTWSIESEPSGIDDHLYNVHVTVQRQRSDGTGTSVTLSQMVLDPQYRGSTLPSSSSRSSSSSTSGSN